MKKLVSCLLAAVMALSLSVPAFASTGDTSPWYATYANVDPIGTYKASDGGTLIIAEDIEDPDSSYTFNLEGTVYNEANTIVAEENPAHYLSADGSINFPVNQFRCGYYTTDGEPTIDLVGMSSTGVIDNNEAHPKGLLWDGKDTFYMASLQSSCSESSDEEDTDNAYYVNLLKTYKKVSSSTFTIDTGAKVSVKAGNTYQFKVTSAVRPTMVSGNSSVFKQVASSSSGSNYYFKFKATGKTGQSAGFYVNGSKTPCTVGTIQ